MFQSFNLHTLFNLVLVTFIPFAVVTPGLYGEGLPESGFVLDSASQSPKVSKIDESFSETSEDASEYAASTDCTDEANLSECADEPYVNHSSL